MTHTYASKIRTSFLTCAIAIGVLAPASQIFAQEKAVEVNIPFGFENGKQHLPAGSYRVDISSEHLMLLRNNNTSAAGFVMVNPEIRLKSSGTGKVIFRKYGDRYFLHEVWVANSPNGLQCVKSKAEKQLQIAANTPEPTNVELALNTMPR